LLAHRGQLTPVIQDLPDSGSQLLGITHRKNPSGLPLLHEVRMALHMRADDDRETEMHGLIDYEAPRPSSPPATEAGNMTTVFQQRIITQELDFVFATVQNDEVEREEGKVELGRLLTAQRQVFHHRFKGYLALYRLICELIDQWRLAVFRGEEPPDPEEDKGFKDDLERWLSLSDPIRQRAEFYDRHCEKLDWRMYHDLRLYTQEPRRSLAEWQPARPSTGKAFRARAVFPQEASALGLAPTD
jgi:hypothetical protein